MRPNVQSRPCVASKRLYSSLRGEHNIIYAWVGPTVVDQSRALASLVYPQFVLSRSQSLPRRHQQSFGIAVSTVVDQRDAVSIRGRRSVHVSRVDKLLPNCQTGTLKWRIVARPLVSIRQWNALPEFTHGPHSSKCLEQAFPPVRELVHRLVDRSSYCWPGGLLCNSRRLSVLSMSL